MTHRPSPPGPSTLGGPRVMEPAAAALSTAPRPMPYHRIARLSSRAGRWWRPFLVLLLAAALAVAFFAIALVVTLLIGSVPGVAAPTPELENPRNPMDVLSMLGVLAVGVPTVALAVRWGGARRRGALVGTLHSVTGRFRWALMVRAAVIVLPVSAVVSLVGFLLQPPADASVPRADWTLLAVYAVILLLTPLQCAAEEYAFRALPQQTLGTWLRHPLWGIVLPVPLFVVGHEYDWVGQIDIAVFALCMGVLTWKSGGIELPILVHTANNLTLFLLSPFSPTSLQQGAVDPMGLLFSVPPTILITLGLCWWISRREGLRPLEPVRGRGRTSTPADGLTAGGPATPPRDAPAPA